MSLTVEEIDQIETTEGARGLRARLEATLQENRTLSKENVSLKSLSVIEENDLTLVQPEDLAGVAASELEETAKRIQQEKLDSQKQLARSVFEQKGLTGSELDSAVNDFLTVPEGKGAVEASAYDRIRGASGIAGERVGTAPVDTDGLSASEILYQAELEASKK
jgi:hypothetical protein